MNCTLDLLVFQMKGKRITVMISKPPISSPFTYTCGYEGQLEKVFRPWRTWYRVIIDRFRVTFTANGKPEFVPGDHVFPSYRRLLFNITTRKSVDSRQFLSLRIISSCSCFYPLIFYFENFSTWIWRLLVTVRGTLNLSNYMVHASRED